MAALDHPRTIEGRLQAKGLRFAVVSSRFNETPSGKLLAAGLDCLRQNGAEASDITVVRVPGSWEIPVVARRLALSKSYDAVIGLGVLIRGETAHFDLIAQHVAAGLARAAEDSGVPVILGVVAAHTPEQAMERTGGAHGNRGWEAALAAIEAASVMKELGA